MKEMKKMKKKQLMLYNSEIKDLERYGVIKITRNGFDIIVKLDDGNFTVNVLNPYDKIYGLGEIL